MELEWSAPVGGVSPSAGIETAEFLGATSARRVVLAVNRWRSEEAAFSWSFASNLVLVPNYDKIIVVHVGSDDGWDDGLADALVEHKWAKAVLPPIATVSVRKALCDFAASSSADLLVLGARETYAGVLPRLRLGSVSDAVLRHARCAILVVRVNVDRALSLHPQLEPPLFPSPFEVCPLARIVAVAVDGKPQSAQVAEWASRKFLRRHDVVYVCHVRPSSSSAVELTDQQLSAWGCTALLEYDTRRVVLSGDPRQCLTMLVERDGIQCLVVGAGTADAGTPLTQRHLMLGSVAQHCAHYAACAVAVVKA